MLTKDRIIAVLSGFACFLGGLYIFAIMSSEINVISFCIVAAFAVVSLYLSATISQNLMDDKDSYSQKKDVQTELKLLELQEKLSSLKTENLRLAKLLESNSAKNTEYSKENQGDGLMLRQRAFIHDIAGPISIAQGMIEMAMKSLETTPHNSFMTKTKLEKALNSVSKISQKIQENRDYLIMAAS